MQFIANEPFTQSLLLELGNGTDWDRGHQHGVVTSMCLRLGTKRCAGMEATNALFLSVLFLKNSFLNFCRAM